VVQTSADGARALRPVEQRRVYQVRCRAERL